MLYLLLFFLMEIVKVLCQNTIIGQSIINIMVLSDNYSNVVNFLQICIEINIPNLSHKLNAPNLFIARCKLFLDDFYSI